MYDRLLAFGLTEQMAMDILALFPDPDELRTYVYFAEIFHVFHCENADEEILQSLKNCFLEMPLRDNNALILATIGDLDITVAPILYKIKLIFR